MRVLGISAHFHDAAAALVVDGDVVAAAEEERFSRVKHDGAFPRDAIAYCLAEGRVGPNDVDAVVYYEKPLVSFLRIVRTRFAVAPHGLRNFRDAMHVYTREKLWVGYEIERTLHDLGYGRPAHTWFAEHHLSHAASAFLPSPFERAAVLTLDGVGEFATSSIAHGVGNRVTTHSEIVFPHSIGLLYSTFTAYCGFRVNSGEYKLMGLAPYGEPAYVDRIFDHVVDLRPDGSFTLDMSYFDYLAGDRMYSDRFCELFGGPPRDPESEIDQRHADLARSIQEVTELLVLGMADQAFRITGERRLCLAGGVALNCVANARLLRDGPFEEVWVQPAAGDAGGALGAALLGYYQLADHPRVVDGTSDLMSGAFLGPAFGDQQVETWLTDHGHVATRLPDDLRPRLVASLINDGNVVAVFTGRAEFGPRALGNRSILADPRSASTQRQLNLRIKKRESFRPFAPAVLAEHVGEWFEPARASPYMMFTAQVVPGRRCLPTVRSDSVLGRVDEVRSEIPAVTHLDHSARVQTVDAVTNPHLHAILQAFEALTGCPVLVNTSFNVRGEPIVCTPDDALRCFRDADIDYLLLGPFLLAREDQESSTDARRPVSAFVD